MKAPPSRSGLTRTSRLRRSASIAKEKRGPHEASARRSRRPPAARLTRACWGWWRYMNASISSTPASEQAAAIRSTSAARRLSGFSQRTCLPAAAARIVHSACSAFGQPDVDAVDLGIGEQRLVRVVGTRDAELGGERPCPVAVARGDGCEPALGAHQGCRARTAGGRCSPRSGSPTETAARPRPRSHAQVTIRVTTTVRVRMWAWSCPCDMKRTIGDAGYQRFPTGVSCC